MSDNQDRIIQRMQDEIDELEEDLMYAKDALRDVRDWINDPNGFSKHALMSIVNRGLRQ